MTLLYQSKCPCGATTKIAIPDQHADAFRTLIQMWEQQHPYVKERPAHIDEADGEEARDDDD